MVGGRKSAWREREEEKGRRGKKKGRRRREEEEYKASVYGQVKEGIERKNIGWINRYGDGRILRYREELWTPSRSIRTSWRSTQREKRRRGEYLFGEGNKNKYYLHVSAASWSNSRVVTPAYIPLTTLIDTATYKWWNEGKRGKIYKWRLVFRDFPTTRASVLPCRFYVYIFYPNGT